MLAVSITAYGDDEAFEQYSMEIGQEIADEQSERDKLNEADSPIHKGVDPEETEEDESLKISAFHGYAWGTSLQEIEKAEITDDLKESAGYSLKKVDSEGNTSAEDHTDEKLYDSLGLKGYQIAGYDATSFYVFDEGKLIGGAYEYFMDKGGFEDTVAQCAESYGSPNLQSTDANESVNSEDGTGAEKAAETEETKSAGNSDWALWVDGEGNFVFAAESLGVVYGEKDSAIAGMLSSGIEQSCGIRLSETVRKARK